MAKLEIEIDAVLKDRLKKAACQRGESEDAVVVEALKSFLGDEEPRKSSARPPRITDPAQAEEILRATAGMWADHPNIPSREEMNREWEERLERLFGHV